MNTCACRSGGPMSGAHSHAQVRCMGDRGERAWDTVSREGGCTLPLAGSSRAVVSIPCDPFAQEASPMRQTASKLTFLLWAPLLAVGHLASLGVGACVPTTRATHSPADPVGGRAATDD